MDILFIGLAIGCIVFLVKIVSQFMNETPIWHNKIELADKERQQYEEQVNVLEASKEDAAAQVKKMDEEIKNLEQMRDQLKAEIDETKKTMARQGKIIMKRQSN